MLFLKGCGSFCGSLTLCNILGAGVGCDVIAQLFVEFHATFEVFHHRQRIVKLGVKLGDSLVEGVLVEQTFSCKRIRVCAMALRLYFFAQRS